jgi:hypothetical protein
MKKKTFFRGLATSFAVATLGLTSVALTSCEKESLSVQPSDVNNTYNFNYSELASYLNQWGIASEASLQKVLSSQLTKAQVEEILNNWDPSYQTLKDYLDNNYKPELENIKNILDAWNPTLTQLQLFLDAWDETLAKIDGISDSLASFLAGYTALSPASATIFITVYDWNTGELLTQVSQAVAADEDGNVAEQLVEVECPYIEGYLAHNAINVTVPALGKGQSAILPITFYLTSLEYNGAKLTVANDPEEKVQTVTEKTDVVKMSEEDVNLEQNQINVEIPITYETGTKVDNIDEVNDYIDNELVITRAITDEQIKTTLKARVALLNNIKTVEDTQVVSKIIKGSIVNIHITPVYEQVVKTMTFEFEDLKAPVEVPNIIVKTLVKNIIEEEVIVVDEEAFQEGGGTAEDITKPSHSNAHGSDANAGGGTASK